MTLAEQTPDLDDPIALEGAAAGAFLAGSLWAGATALLGAAGVGEGGFQAAHALRSGLIVASFGALAGAGVALWWRAGRGR
jgi:hypothetical protein